MSGYDMEVQRVNEDWPARDRAGAAGGQGLGRAQLLEQEHVDVLPPDGVENLVFLRAVRLHCELAFEKDYRDHLVMGTLRQINPRDASYK